MGDDREPASRNGGQAHQPIGTSPARVIVMRTTPSYGSYARSIVNVRKALPQYVSTNLFSDPAFDIVLELFATHEEGELGSLQRCLNISRAPFTTTVRYIEAMVQQGLVVIVSTTKDGCPDRLRLTERALDGMRGWLAATSPIPLRREN